MPKGGWDRRFLTSTRGQVLTLLVRGLRTVEELATALGVTDNAVRSHLAVLERDGLVRQQGVRRSGGQPAHVYDVTPLAEQVFPNAYGPVLGLVMDVLGERLSAEAIKDLLRDVAARLAAESGVPAHRGRTVSERIEQSVAVLQGLGGDVEISDVPETNGKLRLRAFGCPLASAVPHHPELCEMLESMLSELTGARVKEQCSRTGRPQCCFELDFGRRRFA